MLFHNWTPPPIMITKEKLNTYPPLFSNNPLQRRSGLLLCVCVLFIPYDNGVIGVLLVAGMTSFSYAVTVTYLSFSSKTVKYTFVLLSSIYSNVSPAITI